MRTIIPFGDPKAVKKWSGSLFLDQKNKSYFEKKFVGESDNSVIQRLTNLEKGAGDRESFDLSVQLRGKPTAGDNRIEGKEEQLKFFSDEVIIDQLRHAVSAGGKMTRKRTLHDLRTVARDRLGDYWSLYIDQMVFVYLSGARGINQDFIEEITYAGHAENPIQAPDSGHLIYGGAATAKGTMVVGDILSRATIEKSLVKARMMRAVDKSKANMLPVTLNGESHYVMVMSPFQEHDLRTNDQGGWLDIQKAASAAEGRSNPIFKGGLGMINNCVLHSHESVIRFADYGSGGNVAAARALLLGRQAGVIAYGSSENSGFRMSWVERKDKDYGNEPTVAAGTIIGVKKTRFNNADFGVIAVDTAAKDPNA